MVAPEGGAHFAEDDAGLADFSEGADDAGFGLGAHGFVGVVPFAEDAHADEVGFLAGDLLFGEGAALRAEVGLSAPGAAGFFHLVFNGEAVAVPAGEVGGVVSGEGFGADDEVLEAFVDGVSDVDVAVGVGGSVVEDEEGPGFGGASDFGVELIALPLREHFGLAAREVAAHREGGPGQVEGFGVGGFF